MSEYDVAKVRALHPAVDGRREIDAPRAGGGIDGRRVRFDRKRVRVVGRCARGDGVCDAQRQRGGDNAHHARSPAAGTRRVTVRGGAGAK